MTGKPLPGRCAPAGDDSALASRPASHDIWVVERYAVYILASRRNGTLYIGVTSALERRIAQHKARAVRGFTQQYGVTILVYVERYANVYDAIAREKQLKGWNRAWKIKLIEAGNPTWDELDPTAC
jgi:putative endonuclease